MNRLLFLGAGPMAEAIISGIVRKEIMPGTSIYVKNRQNQDRIEELVAKYGINGFNPEKDQLDQFDMIILAMQPNDIGEVCRDLKQKIHPQQLIISIISSVSTEYFEEHLHQQQPIIRVMPNTSSTINESATAISIGKYVEEKHVNFTKTMLAAIGTVYVIEESKMDIFTGIAGCGPAYFYAFMEQMETLAVEHDLPIELARNMIAQTILGSAKMVLLSDEDPMVLRKHVAAPNGPTEAGLFALEAFGGKKAIIEAVKAATERSKEIGKLFNV
ncbi:pyrroline-5-carboxylate reductase [Bacillus ginsengihumi]|uniref:Pyrroline-5-carboxylate reductase n=1 Tax=Heyndrickxia ginsengihumi TaxID=363870 RepID=A0A6M0P702_9BACI|nr:pyrroline-5-carboxylate reductase [Heyndrickxia ginsengihumi]NEY20297.1 pyrroline-5-carboxylate reductase [Heyndrickxia ginsengihumi]